MAENCFKLISRFAMHFFIEFKYTCDTCEVHRQCTELKNNLILFFMLDVNIRKAFKL